MNIDIKQATMSMKWRRGTKWTQSCLDLYTDYLRLGSGSARLLLENRLA